MKKSMRLLAAMLALILCMGMLTACNNTPTSTPSTGESVQPSETPVESDPVVSEPVVEEPQSSLPDPTGNVYDLYDYLWNLPLDGSDEEFAKYAVRNFKFVQSIEPLVSEESYFNLYGASVRLKQNKEGAREEFLAALADLDLESSVADGVYFLWDADNMPTVDGESFTEEELDNGPLDSYGFIPLLVKCMLDDPTQAKGNIILVSGGGMTNRSNSSEAYPAISVFNDLGYNVFVLQRRIRPYSDEDIYMDMQRAIRIVRYYAAQEGWGGQDMIAACGWSGGAATVMGAVNNLYGDLNPTKYDSDYIPDEIDAVNSDLDVAMPIYGGALNDNGENTNLPAFYTCAGTEDTTGAADHVQKLCEDAAARGVDTAINLFEGAGHGFGVGQEGALKSTPECATWPGIADEFMQAHRGYSTRLNFENYSYITTTGVTGEPVTFALLPDAYNEYATEHAMSTVIIHYTTDVYGETYDKYAYVYLPYGYDPEDTETKYNVIYFQHGNGGAPAVFEHDLKTLHAKNLLNNIFDPDHQVMEPCIIVCPTYYLVSDETSYVTPKDNPAGDGRFEGNEQLYHLEVVQDLIPAVESQFNVYCTDFSEEGIKASRDHRAWAGYSRGAICTYYMFHENFEYFAYWMPMSAPLTLTGGVAGSTTPEEAYNYLKEPIEANPDLDFFIYATAGGPSDKSGTANLAEDMQAQMQYYASQTDVFSFGSDPEVNNLYFVRSEFAHNDLYFPYSLANAAEVLFK